MRFSDLSIRNKLLVSAGALFSVSIIGVSLVGSMVMSSAAERAAEREAQALLTSYANEVNRRPYAIADRRADDRCRS